MQPAWERRARRLRGDADGFVALLADGVRLGAGGTLRGLELAGSRPRGPHTRNLDGFELSLDGRTIVYRTSSAQPSAAALGGAPREARSSTSASSPRSIHVRAQADRPRRRRALSRRLGEEVRGLSHFPLDYAVGDRRPLVLDIHGGPTGTDRDTWEAGWHDLNILHRQNGAFVLQVNYHGSAGYGLDWVESIGGGKYYELEPARRRPGRTRSTCCC